MTERPILFSAPMVRAILAGQKTQTRRVIKPQPDWKLNGWYWKDGKVWTPEVLFRDVMPRFCPYGGPGDRLWVRETWTLVPASAYRASVGVQQIINPGDPDEAVIYRATWDRSEPSVRWRPSIHMPRWASRLLLEITAVRVERLQEISEADAVAEGVTSCTEYAALWNKINAKRGFPWESNPWVWVIEFKQAQL